MELNDEIEINAPMSTVYAALNDPEILQQCIPGCEELIKHSDTNLEAKVVLKVGPVKARFSGEVVLDQTGAPEKFSLSGKGNGGAAGHAKGSADVTLRAEGIKPSLLTRPKPISAVSWRSWATGWCKAPRKNWRVNFSPRFPKF